MGRCCSKGGGDVTPGAVSSIFHLRHKPQLPHLRFSVQKPFGDEAGCRVQQHVTQPLTQLTCTGPSRGRLSCGDFPGGWRRLGMILLCSHMQSMQKVCWRWPCASFVGKHWVHKKNTMESASPALSHRDEDKKRSSLQTRVSSS